MTELNCDQIHLKKVDFASDCMSTVFASDCKSTTLDDSNLSYLHTSFLIDFQIFV